MGFAPTFVTHHELEGFLGGGQRGRRQRQRLQQREMLPEPIWLPRIDRLRVAVYPAFALAGLLKGLGDAPRARGRMHKLTKRVYTCAVRNDLMEALEVAVRDTIDLYGAEQWRFDRVVQRVAETAQSAVLEWDAVMREALEDLAMWGIVLSNEFGRVERRSSDAYVVALAGKRTERFSPLRVAAELHKGSAVAVEHVRVMGDGLDVVMPALQTQQTAPSGETTELDWSAVTEADWGEVSRATTMRAEEFSFDADYWREGEDPSSSSGFRVPLDAPSGRSAAAHLLAQRTKA